MDGPFVIRRVVQSLIKKKDYKNNTIIMISLSQKQQWCYYITGGKIATKNITEFVRSVKVP